jgi:hypothetical protein
MRLTLNELRDEIQRCLAEARWSALRSLESDEPSSYRIHAWHSTLLDRWPSISRQGLIPGKESPAGQSWMGQYSGRGIYYHQAFPYHEIDNGYDRETGEPSLCVVEVNFSIYAGYVVPDEEVGSPSDTPRVMKNKEAIVVAFPAKPDTFVALHLVDTAVARRWAEKNVKGLPVQFHGAA